MLTVAQLAVRELIGGNIMVSIKFKGFDADELLNDIKKSVEKDLKKNPEKVLDSHTGDIIEATCKKCGKTTIKILTGGKAQCTKCGLITKVDLNIEYT